MSVLPISTCLASALSIWLLILTWRVVQLRHAAGVSLGDGDDKPLQRAIRGHANLIEYAPMFVILAALAELNGANAVIVAVVSIAFVIGRFAHGYAFAFTPKSVAGRMVGMGLTLLALATMTIVTLLSVFI